MCLCAAPSGVLEVFGLEGWSAMSATLIIGLLVTFVIYAFGLLRSRKIALLAVVVVILAVLTTSVAELVIQSGFKFVIIWSAIGLAGISIEALLNPTE